MELPTTIHRIPYNFLLVVQAGSVAQQLDSENYNLCEGHILLGREGQLAAVREFSPNVEGYFFMMANQILPAICPDEMQLKFLSMLEHQILDESNLDWVLRASALLHDATRLEQRDPDTEYPLMQSILRRVYAISSAEFAPLDRGAELALQFKRLVQEYYSGQREVGFFADELAVSENYLNRCVKKLTGKSAKEYINEVTIYHSQVLLQDFTKSVADDAFDLNFAEPSYFGRLFKRVTGQTPGEYRTGLRPPLQD